jgi:hypothetical protein
MTERLFGIGQTRARSGIYCGFGCAWQAIDRYLIASNSDMALSRSATVVALSQGVQVLVCRWTEGVLN